MTAPHDHQHDGEHDGEPSPSLREQAREHVEQLPAETALGNRDPQGGAAGDPADYEAGQPRS